MIVVKKGIQIEFYDDVKLLPIRKYQQFNKFIMKKSDIGQDFQDYETRTSKAIEFLSKSMIDEAKIELENRRMTVFNAYNSYDLESQCLAIMVKKINGRNIYGFNDKVLNDTIDELSSLGVTKLDQQTIIGDLKKKSKFSLKRIFQKYLISQK